MDSGNTELIIHLSTVQNMDLLIFSEPQLSDAIQVIGLIFLYIVSTEKGGLRYLQI